MKAGARTTPIQSLPSGGFRFASPALPRRGRGFTLLEVLVAIAIIAVALTASLRAAGLGTNNAEELRLRLLGGWVAENLLAEHRARGDWLPLGTHSGGTRQGGIEFAWREQVTSTPNASMRRVDIVVSPVNEQRAVARLSGILTLPPPR